MYKCLKVFLFSVLLEMCDILSILIDEKSVPQVCPCCGYQCTSGMHKHRQRQHPRYTFGCTGCERRFCDTHDLRRHISAAHAKDDVDFLKCKDSSTITPLDTCKCINLNNVYIHLLDQLDNF